MCKPKCPKCGSTDLWDDNFWEGCNKCDYTFNGENAIWLIPRHISPQAETENENGQKSAS